MAYARLPPEAFVPFDNLVDRVGRALMAARTSLATAESCTGGLIAAHCTAAPGSSEWFDCGFVTYSCRAKARMLGVEETTLRADGPVSEAVAAGMARGALARSGAGVSVAVTGLAGPGGGSAKLPVGTVWIGWARRDGEAVALHGTRHYGFEGARGEIRDLAVRAALVGIAELLGR